MLRASIVPFALELFQRRDNGYRGFNGICPLTCLTDMNRPAAHMNPKPDHTSIGPHQHVLLWLWNQCRIRPIASHQCRQCAITSALFFGNRLHMHASGGLPTQGLERIQCCEIGAKACLHVCAAAAIQPISLDPGFKRRAGPHIHRPRGHDIHVSIQDQGAALGLDRRMGSDHVHRVVIVDFDRREPGVVFYLSNINGPSIHLKAA